MCRVTIRQVQNFRITNDSLLESIGIYSFEDYYHARLLHWNGHVSRMTMTRTPRRLLMGWVDNRRPVGAPQMTLGRTVKKALKRKGPTMKFAGRRGWGRLAQDRLA